MAAAGRMLATEIETYEHDTRLHFDVESDLPRFLDSVLPRTDQISQTKVDEGIVEQHIVHIVVDDNQTVRLHRILGDSSSNINAHDKETLRQSLISVQRSMLYFIPFHLSIKLLHVHL